MAGISEKKAEAAHRQGVGFAKHLRVEPGSDRYNAIVYGTKRSKGWKPSRETKKKSVNMRAVSARRRKGHAS